MENLQQKVINWVKTLKGWQCELAYRLLIKEKLENSDIDEIVSMLKEEKQFEDKVFPNIGISINGESIVLLHKIRMPLPPRKEQDRIVLKIEEMFSVLDNIQKALEA